MECHSLNHLNCDTNFVWIIIDWPEWKNNRWKKKKRAVWEINWIIWIDWFMAPCHWHIAWLCCSMSLNNVHWICCPMNDARYTVHLITYHICPLGACKLMCDEYWNAGACEFKTGSWPTTPRPLTVSNVPDSANILQCLSRNCTLNWPKFSSRILYRHCNIRTINCFFFFFSFNMNRY